jgi:hypothetical protein
MSRSKPAGKASGGGSKKHRTHSLTKGFDPAMRCGFLQDLHRHGCFQKFINQAEAEKGHAPAAHGSSLPHQVSPVDCLLTVDHCSNITELQ